jgi:hypothetical protein
MDTDKDHIEDDASHNSYIAVCVFVDAATFSLSRFLATVEGYAYRHID